MHGIMSWVRFVSALFSTWVLGRAFGLQVMHFGWALIVALRLLHLFWRGFLSCDEGAAFWPLIRWSGGICFFFRDLAWFISCLVRFCDSSGARISFCGFVSLRSDSIVSEVRNVLVKFVGVFSGLSWYLRYPRSSPWHSALLELLALVGYPIFLWSLTAWDCGEEIHNRAGEGSWSGRWLTQFYWSLLDFSSCNRGRRCVSFLCDGMIVSCSRF